MEQQFNSSEKIGEIVSKFPKASDIFKEYNIDFCCGGDRELKAAIVEKELDEEEILTQLEESYQDTKEKLNNEIDWKKSSLTELTEHIINNHHAYLYDELPKLNKLVVKILRVHGNKHKDTLSKVHKLFNELRIELEQHLITEEEMLFPLIKEYEKGSSNVSLKRIVDIIEQLEGEHDGAGDILKEIREITDQYLVPDDVCTTFRSTYDRLINLESDLFQHIHLENNILFPRLKNKLAS
ncbi:iron-sulfur cluster repair di-iron protein [Halanaerocella petrolearia]